MVVPTRNGESGLRALLRALASQTLRPGEILIIDSSSKDNTVAVARRAGCRVEVIRQDEFDHGKTRNRAALLATGEILVFMTQDAVPAHPEFLAALIEPIVRGNASAGFARQLPRPDATPLARFQRLFHYPGLDPTEQVGAGLRWPNFASNTALAITRADFFEVGGFPPRVIFGEDMVLSAKLRRAGRQVAYVANSAVVHSHNYTLRQQFRRYFDIGAAIAAAGGCLAGTLPNSDGRRYAVNLFRYLARTREWGWMPLAAAELAAKRLGYAAGQHERLLPGALKTRWSLQPGYWAPGREPWQASDPVVSNRSRAQETTAGRESS